MANITPTPTYDDIIEIDTFTRVKGGPGGPANFQAQNIANRFAYLESTNGAGKIGYDGGTVQNVLDGAKTLTDYTALRAYTGRATSVYITGVLATAQPQGICGRFEYDSTDTTSADNGGTIIVGSDGRRWKRIYKGDIFANWFEGVDETGISNSYAGIIKAQNVVISNGGGDVCFSQGKYKCDGVIPHAPQVGYKGPSKAGLTSYYANQAKLFCTSTDLFANGSSIVSELKITNLFLESQVGGGHIFNWSASGIVAKIEMTGVCLAQRNAGKSIIYGLSTGGIFSIHLHDFEYVYVPNCSLPPIYITSPTVNSVTIEDFWSTSNGQSAAGNPSIWIESTNSGGVAFNCNVKRGVFEQPGSGSVLMKSVANSNIEDCTVYDLSIVPGYYQFAIMKGTTGPASVGCSIERTRSTVGTAGFPDLFLDCSVAGQGAFKIEDCTFSYADGGSSANGSQIVVINSSISNAANFPSLKINAGPTKQLEFSGTATTSADVSFWNGYPGNFDGQVNIDIAGVHSGSIGKNGIFSWGNAYITQAGIINSGAQIYPGTPAGAQQVASGLLAGTGSPSNTNGNDGDFYFRSDGASGSAIYQKRTGTWVVVV